MEFEKVSTTYLITIPLEEFEALLEYESPWGGDARETLYARLRDMGVESDYNGHYSCFISVNIPAEDDDSDFQSEITATIQDQLKQAVEWKKLQKSEKSC